MTAWRRVIELSICDADLTKLTSIARARTEPASRVERARILLGYREDPSFFAVAREPWDCIIRRFSGVLSGPWPTARSSRSTTVRGRAKSPRSPPRPKPGWCRWPAGRRRTWVIPTSRGRPGCWPGTPVSMGQRRATPASTSWSSKILDEQEVKPHKVRHYLECCDPDEGFFSKLARSMLRHIGVASKQELKDRIMAAMDGSTSIPSSILGPISVIKLHDDDSNHENAEQSVSSRY
jgi:hypothetical protein